MKDTKRDTEFLCLTVEMSGKTYAQDLNEDLRINADDINESYIDQPSKFAWWAVLAAQARAKADRIKSAIEKQDEYIRKILTGELDAEVRKNLELEFKLGTDPRFYQALSDFVKSYNDSQPPFSRAELGDPEKAHRTEYHNAWIEGYVPGAKVSDNAEEAELFLDIILEDIFVTHASLLRNLFNRSSASGQL